MSTMPHAVPGIVMIDDNALATGAIERRFAKSSELAWLGAAGDAGGALSLVAERRPAVVLLDVDMPAVDTFGLLRRLSAEFPATAVVMFSGLDQVSLIERALNEGAAGFIHKDEPTAVIAQLVVRAAAGECVLSPLASRAFMRARDGRAR